MTQIRVISQQETLNQTTNESASIPTLNESSISEVVTIDDNESEVLNEGGKAPTKNVKVYLGYKRKLEVLGKTVSYLQALHKDIVSIRLSRRGLKGKFCFAIFNSLEEAQAALKTIKDTEKCVVSIRSDEKTGQACKKEKHKTDVQKLWN